MNGIDQVRGRREEEESAAPGQALLLCSSRRDERFSWIQSTSHGPCGPRPGAEGAAWPSTLALLKDLGLTLVYRYHSHALRLSQHKTGVGWGHGDRELLFPLVLLSFKAVTLLVPEQRDGQLPVETSTEHVALSHLLAL